MAKGKRGKRRSNGRRRSRGEYCPLTIQVKCKLKGHVETASGPSLQERLRAFKTSVPHGWPRGFWAPLGGLGRTIGRPKRMTKLGRQLRKNATCTVKFGSRSIKATPAVIGKTIQKIMMAQRKKNCVVPTVSKS